MGALSPYLNKAIKAQTTNVDGTVNTEANLIAHTILGALEAKATGNSALAGGLGALTAEAAAPLIMQQLYGTKNPENLTESQKQNITHLSQITAALSSGLATDSTAGFVAGAESGKRAVENNYLKVKDLQNWNTLYENAKTPEEKESLIQKAIVVDETYLVEALETRISKSELLKRKADLEGFIRNAPCEESCQQLASDSISQLNFLVYHYDELQQAKRQNRAPDLALGMLTFGGASVIGKILPKLVDKPVAIAAGFGGGSELAGQLIGSKGDITQVDSTKVLISTGVGIATKNMGATSVGLTNAGVEALDALRTGKDPLYEGLSSGLTSWGGAKIGGIIQNKVDKVYNPKSKEYEFEKIHPDIPIYRSVSPNYYPSVVGNSVDNIFSKSGKYFIDEYTKEDKEEGGKNEK